MLMKEGRVEVVATKHQDFVIVSGKVCSKQDVVLSFEENGIVGKILKEVGQTIKKGDVLIKLLTNDLQFKIDEQHSVLQKEIVKLDSYKDVLEKKEPLRIDVENKISKQLFLNEIRVALVLTQQSAANIENAARKSIDYLHINIIKDFNCKVIDKQRIDNARSELENIFSNWRIWSNVGEIDFNGIISILINFEKDLRNINSNIVLICDTLLPLKETGNNQGIFTDFRNLICDKLVVTTNSLNNMLIEELKYQLIITKSNENLIDGTSSKRLTQCAHVEREREKLNKLKLKLEKTDIKSLFNGVIDKFLVSEGEFVNADTPVSRIILTNEYEILFNMTEIEVQGIKIGQQMKVVIETFNHETDVVVRKIDVTEKQINDIYVYSVTLDIANDIKNIRARMNVDLYIPTGKETEIYLIPKTSIYERSNQNYVLVERGSGVIEIPVSINSQVDEINVSVIGDLLVGDIVIFENDIDYV